MTNSPSFLGIPSGDPQVRRRERLGSLTRRMVDAAPDVDQSPLPGTAALLQWLDSARSLNDLRPPSWEGHLVAPYRVVPEVNVPFVRLHVVDADPRLLKFLHLTEPGFEVLQARLAGFQYHWRSDILRAFEEEVPILGRVCVLAADEESPLEHVVVPLISRQRVRELRGWFIFGRLPEDLRDDPSELIVRRAGRSRILDLPASLWRPGERGGAVREAVAALRGRWRRPAERKPVP